MTEMPSEVQALLDQHAAAYGELNDAVRELTLAVKSLEDRVAKLEDRD